MRDLNKHQIIALIKSKYEYIKRLDFNKFTESKFYN